MHEDTFAVLRPSRPRFSFFISIRIPDDDTYVTMTSYE